MGAYGSPEFLPPDNKYNSGARYREANCSKVKKIFIGLFKGIFIFVGILSIIFMVIAFSFGNRPTYNNVNKAMASSPAYSHSEYVPLVPVSSALATSVMVDDSTDFLQAWSKAAVLKALIYPGSAKFSDNLSDWKIVRDGHICEIHSFVSARGKESKKVSQTSFIVKISYEDLNAQVVYISLGDQVCYDSTKPSKGK